MLVDTHAHLADSAFDDDRREVLQRAGEVGVAAVVTVGETFDDASRILELSLADPRLLATAGLYPTHLDLSEAERVIGFARANAASLVAIGEVGLDRWKVREPDDLELQAEIFGRFIRLAGELDLPLNVHSRSAGHYAIAQLLEAGASRVQLHAFDGRAAKAMPAVEAGFFFSVPPSIVRSPQKQKLIRRLPLNCLLVETDSPVLGPDPKVRNEPKNVVLSLQAIAELKEEPVEAVREAVEANTERLYPAVTSLSGEGPESSP